MVRALGSEGGEGKLRNDGFIRVPRATPRPLLPMRIQEGGNPYNGLEKDFATSVEQFMRTSQVRRGPKSNPSRGRFWREEGRIFLEPKNSQVRYSILPSSSFALSSNSCSSKTGAFVMPPSWCIQKSGTVASSSH